MHRSQGATYDSAHILAAGGGRELAYVALSRARQHTTIHATADDLAQAVDDLQADWGVERHQRWVTRTSATVGRHPDPVSARPVERPRRKFEPAGASTRGGSRVEAYQRLLALQDEHRQLRAGTGRWQGTPEGEAGRRLDDLTTRLADARRWATSPGLGRRGRRAATRTVEQLAAGAAEAQHHWQTIGQPIADRLESAITDARRDLDGYELEDVRRRLLSLEHSPGRGGPERAASVDRLRALDALPPARELGMGF